MAAQPHFRFRFPVWLFIFCFLFIFLAPTTGNEATSTSTSGTSEPSTSSTPPTAGPSPAGKEVKFGGRTYSSYGAYRPDQIQIKPNKEPDWDHAVWRGYADIPAGIGGTLGSLLLIGLLIPNPDLYKDPKIISGLQIFLGVADIVSKPEAEVNYKTPVFFLN